MDDLRAVLGFGHNRGRVHHVDASVLALAISELSGHRHVVELAELLFDWLLSLSRAGSQIKIRLFFRLEVALDLAFDVREHLVADFYFLDVSLELVVLCLGHFGF